MGSTIINVHIEAIMVLNSAAFLSLMYHDSSILLLNTQISVDSWLLIMLCVIPLSAVFEKNNTSGYIDDA